MSFRIANTTALTGIPRSGTTLLCTLLDHQTNVVIAAEPGKVLIQSEAPKIEQLRFCVKNIKALRGQIKHNGLVLTRHIDGSVPDNWLNKDLDSEGGRENKSTLGMVEVNKPIDDGFHLVVKNPGAFTALLPELNNRAIRTIAIIRNPLTVLAAWNSTPFPISKGRLPPAERIDRKLAEALSKESVTLDRQLILLSWLFQRYQDHLPKDQIITYEGMVKDPKSAVQTVLERIEITELPELQERNIYSDYPAVEIQRLAEELLHTEGAYWHFYNKEDVNRLLK